MVTRLGPIICPSPVGGGTANRPQPIDNTVDSCGPLPHGRYAIQGDVAFYVLQGTSALTVDATALGNLGVKVQANTEVEFDVTGDADQYLYWTRVSSSGTDLRINATIEPLNEEPA